MRIVWGGKLELVISVCPKTPIFFILGGVVRKNYRPLVRLFAFF
jgi:hypothetical protein